MSLVQAAEQARLFEHEGELTLADPRELASDSQPRICLVCNGFIDRHPGAGRKPHTCGRLACKREHHRILVWRHKNKVSRKIMAATLSYTGKK